MNTVGSIIHENESPVGAVFHRCALQVNPHHYNETFRGANNEGDADTHARAVVETAVEQGVTVLAITDHNSVRDVPAFQRAAKGRDVIVFPGFELSSAEGIHVLCIYPENKTKEELERYLGEFGIHGTNPSPDLSNDRFVKILEKTRTQGGVSIAAHVTNRKGLFSTLSGTALIQAWQTKDLIAIQIPGSVSDLPQSIGNIVRNGNAEYRRAHAAGEELAVAVINARDVVTPEDLKDPSSTCRIKMSEISVEGLRQAFLDPDSRIRLNSDPPSGKHSDLIEISWQGGFLDQAAVRFNSNLNVMIGGRGTGKSTVIESLRYVLDLDPLGDEARKTHEAIVNKVLRPGTQVGLRIRVRHPIEQEYRIERIVPNPPVVRDKDGQISNLLPQEILPRVEVYGQHEISEIARSGEMRTRLLDRFTKREASLDRKKDRLLQDLEKTRQAILGVQLELQQIDERLASLPSLEETLKRYQAAGLEDRLSEKGLLVRERQVIDSMSDRLHPFQEILTLLRKELPIDRTFLSPKALESLPGKEILTGGNDVLNLLNSGLENVAHTLNQTLERAENNIAGIHSRWSRREDEVDTAYRKILRELKKSAVHAEEFIRLRGEIESLQPLRERRNLLSRLENEHATHRRALLAEWESTKAKEIRLLNEAAKMVNERLQNRVQVKVVGQGSREPFFNFLRSEIGGRLKEAIEVLAARTTISLSEFAHSCQSGVASLQEEYGFSAAQARNLADAKPDVLMRIEELEISPTTAINLNTSSPGQQPSWQGIDHLSTGQKATAVLLLLLLESDAPLIVDQPEDDLDNRFITEGIIPKMREEKQRRQFVFATHNANIPVLGDAEFIFGLDASDEIGKFVSEHMGSIDTRSVRDLIEEILEGGKEAFERRRQKYGF